MTNLITLRKDVPLVDSRLLAKELGVNHKHTREMIVKYESDFKEFGKVQFQTEASPSGQRERYALLNEDQVYLLLTFSRNTKKIRSLKVKLVKAFREARDHLTFHQLYYLPTYHSLQDMIASFGGGKLHLNVNRLINKTSGVKAGERSLDSVIEVAYHQSTAMKAMAGAKDSKEAYAKAKEALH